VKINTTIVILHCAITIVAIYAADNSSPHAQIGTHT